MKHVVIVGGGFAGLNCARKLASHSNVRIPGSSWMLVDGVITLVLGILVWAQWPIAALWIIGLFIGINLITTGCSQIFVAFAVRRLATEPV